MNTFASNWQKNVYKTLIKTMIIYHALAAFLFFFLYFVDLLNFMPKTLPPIFYAIMNHSTLFIGSFSLINIILIFVCAKLLNNKKFSLIAFLVGEIVLIFYWNFIGYTIVACAIITAIWRINRQKQSEKKSEPVAIPQSNNVNF